MKVRNLYFGSIFIKEKEIYASDEFGDTITTSIGILCRKSILYKLSDDSKKVKDIAYGGTYKIGIDGTEIGDNYASGLDSTVIMQLLAETGYTKKNYEKKTC